MTDQKMHTDEVDIDEVLVHRLVQSQFPHWAQLPVRRVPSAGTDNALYRLGDDLVVRLPRIQGAVGQVEKEQRWLSFLAPKLPLAIPVPQAQGEPDAGYPFPWSIYEWLDGENATLERLTDHHQAARDLAEFIHALQAIDATGAPVPGGENSGRGVPLEMRDEETRQMIGTMPEHGDFDVDLLNAVWDSAVDAPVWEGPPKWIHGDLQSGNLLAQRGRLSAVIDFGCLGAGDPACDLMVAWTLFDRESRETFRTAMRVDHASWLRGRGWALSFGVIAYPYYRMTNPTLAGIALHAINESQGDFTSIP